MLLVDAGREQLRLGEGGRAADVDAAECTGHEDGSVWLYNEATELSRLLSAEDGFRRPKFQPRGDRGLKGVRSARPRLFNCRARKASRSYNNYSTTYTNEVM